MVRCEENIVNTDVFLKSQIFDFFDILVSSGRPGTSFWRLFGHPGPHFGGPGGCCEYSVILLRWLAGLGGPKILPPLRLEGKMELLAPGPAVQQIAGLGQQD